MLYFLKNKKMHYMKKSNIKQNNYFTSVGNRVCLPLILTLKKVKNVNIYDDDDNIVGQTQFVKSSKEKIVELWIPKVNINCVQSYINSRNEISPVRCYITDAVSNESYLIASSPKSIINLNNYSSSGYGSKV